MKHDAWDRGNTDAEKIPDAILFTRLAETLAWCAALTQKPNVSPSLRSDRLSPRLFHRGADDMVCSVGRTRAWCVKDSVPSGVSAWPDPLGGRLLIYFPHADLCDGAAQLQSQGFFDVFNTPPWDTWIGYFCDQRSTDLSYKSYLLAYVPVSIVELASEGIDVNPEQCIQWLTDAPVAMRDRIATVLHG